MSSKFNIGDKVVIKRRNDRISKELLDSLRLDHPRTIVAIFYDHKTQHNRYYLGTNKRGKVDLSSMPIRASSLKSWSRGTVGRPSMKRRYRRRTG